METDGTLRILGVDPGTLRLGFGLLEVRGAAARVLTSGVLVAPAGWETSRRIGKLARELAQLLDAERLHCVALEASFFGKNPHSLIRMGEARGMVLALAGAREIPVHDYPPATVKRSVTGNGGAAKEQVARVLGALLPELGRLKEGDRLDRTDAIAVAWCHSHQERLRERERAVEAVLRRERGGESA